MSAVCVSEAVSFLTPYVNAGVLGPAEVHLADWVARASGVDDELVLLGAAVASWAALHGHTCADLSLLASAVERERPVRQYVDDAVAIWPATAVWLEALRAGSPVVRVVDGADTEPVLDNSPLVLCGTRLYLQRHWVDECTVAASLIRRVSRDSERPAASLSDRASRLLDRLLPPTEDDGSANQQRRAADLVFARNLALVVGGPGTGKTYSVARLLMALLTDAEDRGASLRVALAAPTGKAAARLSETIRAAVARAEQDTDDLSDSVKATMLALEPSTVHRLLGSLPDRRQRFVHRESNPLPYDVVLIDETSMVSTPLLARLVEAVPASSRLVLIGDPDQLESVELGAALGDIVTAAERSGSPLHGHAVRLQRGHRFEADSPIALLADCVREARADDALAMLRKGVSGLSFIETSRPASEHSLAAVQAAVAPVMGNVQQAAASGDGAPALDGLAAVRMLCAHRLGEFGVSFWNEWGERWMCGPKGAGTAWYPGRPLLVTKNNFRLGLSNGDTGVVIKREDRLVAVFAGPATGSTLEFEPVELEDVETAYATTIHKSQGSEYAHVVLVLPPATSPLVGRELVYTAITRAKAHLMVVGSEAALRACILTPARRMTGLAAALV